MDSSRALFAVFLLLGIVPRKHADHGNGIIQPNCSEVHIRKKSGTIESPGYPERYRFEGFCNHEIGVRSKMQVLLNFTEVDFANDFGRIYVFDGSGCLSKRIGLVLNGNFPVFISSGKLMTVLSLTDGLVAKWRFRAEYSTVTGLNASKPIPYQDNCGKELTDSTGNFSYRGHGKVHVLCVWRITVSSGGIVHLGFNRLIMKSHGSRLRVLDGGTCGGTVLATFDKDQPLPQSGVNSTGNSMTVVYSTVLAQTQERIDAFYSSIISEEITTTLTPTTANETMDEGKSEGTKNDTINLNSTTPTTSTTVSRSTGGNFSYRDEFNTSPAITLSFDIPYTLLLGILLLALVVSIGQKK